MTMKKLLLPGLILGLAGFGCGSESPDPSTTARADTVTIGAESDVIALGDDSGEAMAMTYARQECTLNEVQFESGEDTLTEEGYARLHELGTCVKAGEIAELMVIGREDPSLGAAETHRLAERRAMVVVDYLLDEGVEEPDVRYDARQGVEGFALVWPDAVLAARNPNQG
jgi:outer membrane protein OmpA-like peptidoglycan-associated protein